MKKHLLYAKYIVRHKYFVYRAGRWTGAPLWRLIIHDWSKLLPSEWIPYTEYFYGTPLPKEEGGYTALQRQARKQAFDYAWLHHIHHNPHHWQHWILTKDSGTTKPQPMPEHFVREMVADWAGAGRAIKGKWDITDWYAKNKKTIQLHDDSRKLVEQLIAQGNLLGHFRVPN